MGCLWYVHVQQWSTVCIEAAVLFERPCDDAKAMLHLQLDVALMNGARQEHYMFDPSRCWSLSLSVKSVSKVSAYRGTYGHGNTGKVSRRKCVFLLCNSSEKLPLSKPARKFSGSSFMVTNTKQTQFTLFPITTAHYWCPGELFNIAWQSWFRPPHPATPSMLETFNQRRQCNTAFKSGVIARVGKVGEKVPRPQIRFQQIQQKNASKYMNHLT